MLTAGSSSGTPCCMEGPRISARRADAVSVDAEEAHAAIRPQVPADGRLDAGLDETDDEVTSKCLALGSKEGR